MLSTRIYPFVLQYELLYGAYDVDSGFWKEGIIESTMKSFYSSIEHRNSITQQHGNFHDLCVIIFDGAIDGDSRKAGWVGHVEYMFNSPLTAVWDSKAQIHRSDHFYKKKIHFLFETLTMSHASPQLLASTIVISFKLSVDNWMVRCKALVSLVFHDKNAKGYAIMIAKALLTRLFSALSKVTVNVQIQIVTQFAKYLKVLVPTEVAGKEHRKSAAKVIARQADGKAPRNGHH